MKYLRLFAILLSIISIGILIYIIFIPYSYNENTAGKDISSPAVLNKLSYIVNKKYETILYEDCINLKKMYWNNSYSAINKMEKSDYVYTLRDKFDRVIVNKLQQKSLDTYIVYYTVNYTDDTQANYKMIIKYNKKEERAVILYDSSFEVIK